MEGFEEVVFDGERYWLVWDRTDEMGYDHRITLRDRQGHHIWVVELERPQSIVNKRVENGIVKIWTGDGDLMEFDLKSGAPIRSTFVK